MGLLFGPYLFQAQGPGFALHIMALFSSKKNFAKFFRFPIISNL